MKNLYLLTAALIWGFAFVAQSIAVDSVPPLTFTVLRFGLGAFVLFIIAIITKAFKGVNIKKLIKDGSLCGLALYGGALFQQIGIQYTTAAKAGFVTVLYIVFVPIMAIFMHKKPSLRNWICILFALCGFYLLSINERFELSFGDFIVLIGSLLFSIQMILIDKYASDYSAVCLNIVQYLTICVVGFLPALVFEGFKVSGLPQAMPSFLYAGIMSCGIAYTLQTVGQKNNDPTRASLILSLESVFAAIGGFLILKETLSLREMLGCLIIFVATIIIQLPQKKKN